MLGEKFVAILPPAKMDGRFIEPGEKSWFTRRRTRRFLASSAKVLEKVEGIADCLE
jgi:hypothetical protein